ncbi:MAG: ROK family protein [Dehalococcoidia bacterium]|nr:ROK family protein [Dehalococcoidia bacterium]
MHNNRHPIVAVDLGGTRLRVALMDAQARVLARRVEPTRAEERPERVAERIGEAAEGMRREAGLGAPAAVGAGIASPLDSKGVLHHPPNLAGWGVVRFKEMLEKRFKLPVAMGNDANLAALGEHRFGAGQGVDDLVYLTISTGVGGGVISRGRLITGARGLGAEAGHIMIAPDGPAGPCGHRGCLESLVSGTAIARRAAEGVRLGRRTTLGSVARLRAEEVFAAAKEGDAFARELIGEVARDMARGIVSLVHVFNPSLVLMGGGVSQNWGMLAGPVEEEVRRLAMPGFMDGCALRASALGDDAGLAGAVVAAGELLGGG